MKLKLSAVLLFSLVILSAQAQMVTHEVSVLAISPQYIINDNAPLRSDSNVNASLLKILPIGSICYLIERAETDTITVNGVQSQWYKVNADGYTGWIWGGNIAQYIFGSNEQPDVKFLIGYGAQEKIDNGNGYKYLSRMVHIKAVKGNKLMNKIALPMWPYYFDASIMGSSGVENVNDILSVHAPCVGGCGCSTGNTYIFWDGKKLHNVLYVGGTADADFSEWSEIAFPSNAAGEKGYIITYSDSVIDDREVGEYADKYSIIKRGVTINYYKWNGEKLMTAKEKPPVNKVYYTYFNNGEHKSIEKPELWEDGEEANEGE